MHSNVFAFPLLNIFCSFIFSGKDYVLDLLGNGEVRLVIILLQNLKNNKLFLYKKTAPILGAGALLLIYNCSSPEPFNGIKEVVYAKCKFGREQREYRRESQ